MHHCTTRNVKFFTLLSPLKFRLLSGPLISLGVVDLYIRKHHLTYRTRLCEYEDEKLPVYHLLLNESTTCLSFFSLLPTVPRLAISSSAQEETVHPVGRGTKTPFTIPPLWSPRPSQEGPRKGRPRFTYILPKVQGFTFTVQQVLRQYVFCKEKVSVGKGSNKRFSGHL